ncbi:acyl-CoA dehydrogenase family protein [Brumicola pallidula]|jgi:alkylation response protein AidB-like acyl-CoA dehydrogenase|uniref:3-methylmercaptopropionyl-CoA dehydrogenase n=1 Tax=Brumicola pallidula DSM 14239 = ACAM 615 TaxID=1121922 RepID=K6YBC0_9ALTE|nr:acyl-CoA dehydrogenase family protein [Glaciecola pallidula]GAC30039.1 acyl-CoA dehydrogenase [Glaciecola pallidula DSM 14239 = ACAM 615]
MPQFKAPTADIQFLLNDWLAIDQHYLSIGAEGMDSELINEIIAQGAKFAEEAVAPLNREGDEEGCKLVNGSVTTPTGFAQAYKQYIANGWNAMLGNPDFDGQDLPYTAAIPVHEMLNAANLSWRLTTMLTESAVLAVDKHATEQLKTLYLSKLISGEWTGTMNLTEPHAGTDLALLNSKAIPQDDGSYSVTGNKIFITGGDHDWTTNIIHLVLARLPDAPAGVRGISLFLVPKFLLNENAEPGEKNAVSVGSIEKKMGIKGSPTCVMNYDGAKGWLVGEENKGLACMFTMMNDARFQVGLQGLGAAEASYQGALSYARDRLQSRAPQGVQQPDQKADAILHQPDVKKMLLTQKALTEGCRALAMLYAQQMDVEKYTSDERHEQAKKVIAFLTPICKGFMTDMATEVTNIGIQVYGGHGYVREWGMEQLVRDTRIAQLYEGTNGIQAADLIGRKLTRDGGDMQQATFTLLSSRIATMTDSVRKAQAVSLLQEWNETSQALLGTKAEDIAGAATDYLHYSAYSLLGVLWLDMASAAEHSSNEHVARGKANTCNFYMKRLLPRKDIHKSVVLSAADDLMAVEDQQFDYI